MTDKLRERVVQKILNATSAKEVAAILALREAREEVAPDSTTWCPECGPDVKVDEDGCCASCGATATGPGARRANLAVRAAQYAKDREAALVKALCATEWGDRRYRSRDGIAPIATYCPECGNGMLIGHSDDCIVGAALAPVKGAKTEMICPNCGCPERAVLDKESCWCGVVVVDAALATAKEGKTESDAVADVLAERRRQDAKWGEQNHDPALFLTILMEEVGEYAQAALQHRYEGNAGTALREEAVQVAAVAVAIIECIDRGKWEWGNHALASVKEGT